MDSKMGAGQSDAGAVRKGDGEEPEYVQGQAEPRLEGELVEGELA